MSPSIRPYWRGAVSGAAVGGLGVAGFGAVHALSIVPIWDRLLGGLPFALVAGTLLGWAWAALASLPRLRHPRWLHRGYGVLVWATTLPALAFGTLRRIEALPGWLVAGETAATLALTALGAVLVARWLGAGWRAGGWRVPLVFALGCCALLAGSGGPIPVANGGRAVALFVGVSVLWWLAGLAIPLGTRMLERVAARRVGHAT